GCWPAVIMLLSIAFFLLAAGGVLSSDCPEFCSCNSPHSVFCSNRRSSTVPTVPISTRHLYIFQNDILQGNHLTSLPSLIFPRLLLLDLSHNKIPTLEPSDLHTPHLELDLSMNKLTKVPQALKQESLKGLTKLNLATNPLFKLNASDLQQLVALQELDLSGINLQGFPEGFFESFPKLSQLSVAENPFNCLCPLAWFPVWLKEKGVNLKRPEETRCHFPLVNAGKKLSALEHKDFACPLTTTKSTGSPVENTPAPQIPTTPSKTTHTNAIPPPPPPSDETFTSITDSCFASCCFFVVVIL
uniref:LRRCT domain-containing protein n=1 Tax=Fundulus heteroclitus TaxID=8078 RepID=A0A3Q2TP78_FUNHE